MRVDVETQYAVKNPWERCMNMSCIDRLETGAWHKLRLVKSGPRIHGSINGGTVFDFRDSSTDNNGPVLNGGRLFLRQMYKTSIIYRDLAVYSRGEESGIRKPIP